MSSRWTREENLYVHGRMSPCCHVRLCQHSPSFIVHQTRNSPQSLTSSLPMGIGVRDARLHGVSFTGDHPSLFRYDRDKCSWRYMLDTQLICAMAPPGGARAVISPRTQSRFNLLNVTAPNDSQVAQIIRATTFRVCQLHVEPEVILSTVYCVL